VLQVAQAALDQPVPQVVAADRVADVALDQLGHPPAQRAGRQPDHPVPPAHLERQGRWPNLEEGGPAHDRRHAGVGLDRGRLRAVGPGHRDLRDQALDRPLGDVHLAQSRQHVTDEGQVRGTGADDQHPVPGQPLAVLVEQEGGAVQADGRLAGPRAALDAERLAQRRPDQVVLLGLDGGDDVAHRADARPFDLGDQHTVGGGPGLGLVQQVEDLVLDRGQGASPVAEPAPDQDAVAPGRAGPVERVGEPGPPVDDHRVALLVAHVAAAHVEPRLGRVGPGVVVQPPEEQPGPAVVAQGGDPLAEPPLHRLGGIGVGPGGPQRPGPPPHRRQAPPGILQHLPLGEQLGIGQRLRRTAHTRSPRSSGWGGDAADHATTVHHPPTRERRPQRRCPAASDSADTPCLVVTFART
jgi:hypothetical protein